MDQCRARSTVDQPPSPAMELTGAQPSGRSGPRLLAARWGKGGRHGDSILPSTEAWKVARRRRTSVGAPTRSVGDVGSIERRGQADGVGVFHQGRGVLL
jgi:hypothetical protein